LKTDFNFGDDLTTNIPQLKDILDGPIISKRDPILGDFESPVAIVLYSDFECLYCREQENVLRRIIEEYPIQVQLIWKDYPEFNFNSYSWKAAKAGRCAQEQKKFWEYHDLLFESIDDKSDQKFLSLANNLKLNASQFEKCFNGREKEELIMDNMLEAQALEIIGIPFIYVNDKEIMGNINYEDLKEMIDFELQNK
jgi:protein-disulfide isomerase